MKVVWIKSFDGLDIVVRETPGPGLVNGSDVVVKVKAAGLNRADLLQAKGLYPAPRPYSRNVPGLEFAGEVVEVGESTTRFSVGDRVFGITGGHGQAEFVVSDASLLATIPSNLSYVEAAAVPEAFVTAHDAIFTLGQLRSGETLMIHAVGSGVGLAGLQLAKAAGATVIGTSRTADKLERCREFGLDVALLAEKPNDLIDEVKRATNAGGVNVVLDLVGAEYLNLNVSTLAQRGRLILVGLTSGRTAELDMGAVLQKRASVIGTTLRGRSLDEKAAAMSKFAADVIPLLSNGQIRPVVDKVFPLADVVDAYRYLASNESFGKVVLEF